MKNIDFPPSVFDSSNPEPPERRPSNWRLFLIFALPLALIGALVYAIILVKSPVRSQLESDRLSGPYESPYVPARNISPTALTPASGPENCSGSEVICTVATASKPADLLRKLIAAIPAASAKQYRVRLSVTAIEEFADDNMADSSKP